MRTLLLVSVLTISSFNLKAQELRDSLFNVIATDTVVAFSGTAPKYYDCSVLIKYTGDPKKLFNELAAMHALDPDAVQRTPITLYIPQTNRPFWVYGTYSVYANFRQKPDYALVEIWYSAYNRPGNHVMTSAPEVYQKVVNRLLGK
jgi:hypothetical protein